MYVPPTVQVVISRVCFKRYQWLKRVVVKLHSVPWLRFRSRMYQRHSPVEMLLIKGSREPSKQSSWSICDRMSLKVFLFYVLETYHTALRILTLEVNIDCINPLGVKEMAVIMASMYHPLHTSMIVQAKCTYRDWTVCTGCMKKQIAGINYICMVN